MQQPDATTAPADATAVVVIAHGSRAAEANEAHGATCEALATLTGTTVVPAFLELTEPTLDTAVTTLVAGGTDRVVVLPYFLYPGNHMQRDIPALIDAARSAHPGVTIDVGQLFGDDNRVIDILADQLRRVLHRDLPPDAAEDR